MCVIKALWIEIKIDSIICSFKYLTSVSHVANISSTKGIGWQSIIVYALMRRQSTHNRMPIEIVVFPHCKVPMLQHSCINKLEDCGLNKQKCIGQGYDGASNMSGLYGYQKKFRESAPRALHTHCRSHCLALSIRKSCCEIPEVRNMFGTVSEVISHSNPPHHHRLPAPSQIILGSAVRVLWVHNSLFSAPSSFNPLSFMSTLIQSIHLLLSLPLPLPLYFHFHLQCHPCWFTSFCFSHMPKLSQICLPHLNHNGCPSVSFPNFLVPDYVPSIHLSILISVLLSKFSLSYYLLNIAPYTSTGLTTVLHSLPSQLLWHFPVTHYPCDLSPFGPSHINSVSPLLLLHPPSLSLCLVLKSLFQFHFYSIQHL